MSAPPRSADARLESWLASACERDNARDAVRELVQRFAADAQVERFQIVLAQAGQGCLAWCWTPSDGAQPSVAANAAPLAGSETERALEAGRPVPFSTAADARDPWLAGTHVHGGFTAPLPGGAGSVGAYVDAPRSLDTRLSVRLTQYAKLLWPLLCRESVENGSLQATRGMEGTMNWAHEINNALSAIVLHADLALSMHKFRAGDPIATLLEQICAESIRCANIVRQRAG